MKRVVLLLVLAAVLCATIAILATYCTANTEDISNVPSDSQNEGATEEKSVPEKTQETEQPSQTPPDTEDLPQSGVTENTRLHPDLQGKVQSVGDTSFSLMPITVTGDSGGVAAAGIGTESRLVEVDRSQAAVETMRVHNGNHEEPQAAEASALQEGQTVHLFGSWQDNVFVAQTVRILLFEDDPA